MKKKLRTNLKPLSMFFALAMTACLDKETSPPTGPDGPDEPYALDLAYDTLAGAVSLSWKETEAPLLADYAVFRDNAGQNELSRFPIAYVSRTEFRDTVFRVVPDSLGEDGPVAMGSVYDEMDLRYRVRIRTLNDSLGSLLAYNQVRVVPPERFRTFMNLRELDHPTSRVPTAGTLRVRLDYANDSRSHRNLAWYAGTEKEPIRTRSDLGASGTDILDIPLPLETTPLRVRVRMEDESGKIWVRSMDFLVQNDTGLVADAGTDFVARRGDTVAITASAELEFGTITKWEWDIGNTGRFEPASPGDTLIVLPMHKDSAFPCVLRVTTQNGVPALDTVRITISPTWTTASLPGKIDWRLVTAFEDRIYLMGTYHTSKVYQFDPGTNLWSEVSQLPRQRADHSACTVGGKIYLVGGREKNASAEWVPTDRVDRYDPLTGEWTEGSPSPLVYISQAVEMDGRIYGLNTQDNRLSVIVEYTPSSGAWRELELLPQAFSGIDLRMAALGGKLYFMPMSEGGDYKISLRIGLGVYDPAADLWETRSIAPNPNFLWDSGFGIFNGKMVFPGGRIYPATEWWKEFTTGIQTYDPETDLWGSMIPSILPSRRSLVVPIGDRFYILGGLANVGSPNPDLLEVEAYQP